MLRPLVLARYSKKKAGHNFCDIILPLSQYRLNIDTCKISHSASFNKSQIYSHKRLLHVILKPKNFQYNSYIHPLLARSVNECWP